MEIPFQRRYNLYPDRGVTVVNASGFYSGQDVKMLFVLAKQRQAPARWNKGFADRCCVHPYQ